MTEMIMNLLSSRDLSLKKVAEKSDVSINTLKKSVHKPIESWSIRVLNAFAIGLDTSPGELLNTLEPTPYILNINDHEQTIQGVFIADKETFQQIRAVIEANHLEGWNPTASDVQDLLNSANNPNPDMVKRFNEIWNEE